MAHPADPVAGPLGAGVALLAALASLGRGEPLPDIAAVALYVEPPLFAGWAAPLAGLTAAVALTLRCRRLVWAGLVGGLLALAPPLAAMPLALVAVSLAALPRRGRHG